MISNQKYRINSLAKDLGLKSKQLTGLLPGGDAGITHQLTPDEFGYVIDTLTASAHEVSIDDYIGGKLDLGLPARKSSEKHAKGDGHIEKAAEPARAEKNAEAKPERKDADAEREKEKERARAAAEKAAEKRVQHGRSERMQQLREAPRPDAIAAKANSKMKQNLMRQNQQRQQKLAQQNQMLQRNTSNEEQGKILTEPTASAKKTRIVDTRTSSVDLSRYDEKLDRFVSENSGAKKQSGAGDRGKNTRRPMGRNAYGTHGGKNRIGADKRGKKQQDNTPKQPLEITIPESISVRDLAARLKVTAAEVIKRLMSAGVMANVTEDIDFDTALYVAEDIGAKATKEVVVTIEDRLFDDTEDSDDKLIERAPVVVVMGHVDHGKTSLLDKIRNANVTAGEAGGITQHIGAYRVNIHGKDITFLDTPGHAAFTAMRARGAKATDIAIIVVAADDGIMPQTIEAINHAKDAGLEIIVAINKMDKPGAKPDNVLQELTKYELVPEEWGGDVMCVPVSAHTGMGIDTLLEDILLIAEVKEYKANPNRRAKGTVIEAKLDKGRGPVATVLVQNGTLNIGDVVIAGTAVGRVRAMIDDKARNVKDAGPSVPVEIIGLDEVPAAGDEFNAVENERMARELAEQRKSREKEASFKSNATVSLDDLFAQISEGTKELKIIVKADVGGSAEAVKSSLEKLSNDEVRVKIIHGGVGAINESDVMLANASNAIIVGFNVRPDPVAAQNAERDGVDIRCYRIIYDCIDEIEAAIKGMLAPKFREVQQGRAEVRQVVKISSVGNIAGCYVLSGKVTRNSKIRVVRDGIVITEDEISSLRRFKDDVKEVAQNFECGIGLAKFNDIKEGDIFEAFTIEEYRD